MNLSSQKSAIALSASAAALLMPVSAFAEDGAAGADILIPKMAEFIPALIAFLIIWIVLAKVALPGIMKTMEERGKKIESKSPWERLLGRWIAFWLLDSVAYSRMSSSAE